MRTSVATLGGISILFVGIFAIAQAAQNSQDAAYSAGNGSAAAWNMSHDVFQGVGTAAGPGVVWMGIAAMILVFLGVLVAAGRSGR